MPVIVGVALGGALGASSRYLLDHLIEQRSFSIFPWATFTINVTGCLLIGVITEALVDRHHVPAWIRVGLVLGVIGGYTTFSTFATLPSRSRTRSAASSPGSPQSSSASTSVVFCRRSQ